MKFTRTTVEKNERYSIVRESHAQILHDSPVLGACREVPLKTISHGSQETEKQAKKLRLSLVKKYERSGYVRHVNQPDPAVINLSGRSRTAMECPGCKNYNCMEISVEVVMIEKIISTKVSEEIQSQAVPATA